MKKGVKNILILATLVLIFSIALTTISNAESVSSMVNSTKPSGVDSSIGSDLATNVIAKILGFLQVASGLISVVVIAFTGFNYIVASDPNIKEELKKKMLPMIIGLVLVFSATTIAKFILGVVYIEPVIMAV